jgi:hypothetical protein
MDDPTPTDAEPAVRCDPADAEETVDSEHVDAPPVQDERMLEEAGYGYGV